jgi:hypothetical protein
MRGDPEDETVRDSQRSVSRRRVLERGAAVGVAVTTLTTGTASGEQGCDIRVPEDYSRIQQAIDNASPGETVCVGTGTYEELQITIDVRDLTLKATGDATIETALGGESVVVILEASGVTVKGFTVQATNDERSPREFEIVQGKQDCTVKANRIPRRNGRSSTPSPSSPGILVNGTNGTVKGNHLTDAPIGGDGYDGAVVQGNRFEGSVPNEGIWALATDGISTTIRGNNMQQLTTDTSSTGSSDIGLYSGVPDSVNGKTVEDAEDAATILHCQNNVDTAAVDGTVADECRGYDDEEQEEEEDGPDQQEGEDEDERQQEGGKDEEENEEDEQEQQEDDNPGRGPDKDDNPGRGRGRGEGRGRGNGR